MLRVSVCVCVISNQSTSKKPHYVSGLSKLGALLHKTHIKVLRVLTYDGSTSVDPWYHWSCFLSNFYFFTKWQPFRNNKKGILFHLNSSFCSKDVHIFFILSTLFIFRMMSETGMFYVMNWLHKFPDAIFRITQKPPCIISSNLVRWYITNKGIFLKLFCNLKSDCLLFPGPYCFKGLG